LVLFRQIKANKNTKHKEHIFLRCGICFWICRQRWTYLERQTNFLSMLKLMLFLTLFFWFVVYSLQETLPVKLSYWRAKVPYLWLIIVLTDCALPEDWPVGTETCRSLCTLKHYCNYKEVCAFCWFILQQCYHNAGSGKCKIPYVYIYLFILTIFHLLSSNFLGLSVRRLNNLFPY